MLICYSFFVYGGENVATYKRINQLDQTYSATDEDFLAIDKQGFLETQKIKKSDLLYGYVVDAPNNESTKNWSWVRKNGNWYRIYPDDYITEAPVDGQFYVRINGQWASVTGVNGDMLQSIYDKNKHNTDIFEYVDEAVGGQDNATEALLGDPIVKSGNSIFKDFTIESKVLGCFVYGQTIEILEIPEYGKSFDNKSELIGLSNLDFVISGKDLIRNKKFSLGSYLKENETTIARTKQPTKVNPGEQYKIENSLDNLEYRFFSVDSNNKITSIFNTVFLTSGAIITIPENVYFIGTEFRMKNSNEQAVYQELVEPLNDYVFETIICQENKYKKIEISCKEPLYSISDGKTDYLDLINKKEKHFIKKEILNSNTDWAFSNLDSAISNSTAIFEYKVGEENLWTDTRKNYGNSNCLIPKIFEDFLISDTEGISFYKGKIYVRINYLRIERTSDQTEEEILTGFKNYLFDKTIEVLYEKESLDNQYDLDFPDFSLFDSISNFNCFYSVTNKDEDIFGNANLLIKFSNVVNSLIRKAGDQVEGQIVFLGEHNLISKTIDGSDGEGSLSGKLYLNKNSNFGAYINGENKILDIRDFSTKLDWAPKAKTISEKEANDQRIVNAEYIHRDYAPLDSPSLVGIPTAPKASSLGTAQIATGEFIEENYFNKEEAGDNFISSTNGMARGSLILDETLPEIITNKKRIPNVEFLESYYLNTKEIEKKYAPLNSPNLTGAPTVPTPDETIGSQITNVDYVSQKMAILDGKIDMIPKYTYLSGISFTLSANSWPEQETLDEKVIVELKKKYPSPKLWDAVAVAVTLLPSDKKRDLLYYYSDGTTSSAGWYYLYDLSTSINRANGDSAGIVESSNDVVFVDGLATVKHSEKADKDSNGKKIDTTYATKEEMNLKSSVYLVKWEG